MPINPSEIDNLIFDKSLSLRDFILQFEKSEMFRNAFIESDRPAEIIQKLKSEFTFIEAAGGIVLLPDEKFLIIERFGKWDLPKGKMETGEDALSCAIREIEEECGISGFIFRKELNPTFHTYRLKSKFVLKKTHWFEFFYAGNEKPVPQSEEDITKAEFISKTLITKILSNTYPSIRDVMVEVFPEFSVK